MTTNLEINKLNDLSSKIYSLTQNSILTWSKRGEVKLGVLIYPSEWSNQFRKQKAL